MAATFTYDRIAQAARIYNSNRDAARALGVSNATFGRQCRRYGIETPNQQGALLVVERTDQASRRCIAQGCKRDRWSPKEPLCAPHMAARNRGEDVPLKQRRIEGQPAPEALKKRLFEQNTRRP